MTMISKRFPADTRLKATTFLTNDKINGELYELFQSFSKPFENIDGSMSTIVPKKDLPIQADICAKIGIQSPKTLRTKIKNLEEEGFIIEVKSKEGDYYVLPEREEMFLMIPLKTLQFLNNNCKDHVIKIYIYLGQRYKYALAQGHQYEFTLEELGAHCGVRVKNYSRGYQILKDALDLLENNGLIEYVSFFNGQMQKKKLVNFSFHHKGSEKG